MIKYNPYNWNIRAIEKKMNMPVFPGSMIYNCVLDELGHVCTELDMAKLHRSELKNELDDLESRICFLEDRKLTLIKKMCE